jgi:hypothetical protein
MIQARQKDIALNRAGILAGSKQVKSNSDGSPINTAQYDILMKTVFSFKILSLSLINFRAMSWRLNCQPPLAVIDNQKRIVPENKR